MTKVFISYSHDSQPHRDFVRGITDQLRTDGLDCLIDQYVNGFPPEGWQRWMENQIEAADFVLLVCTATYLRRYRGQETNGGKGVTFEGVVISQTLYDHYYRNTKFVPVLPEGGDFGHVPLPLKSYTAYTLPQQYDSLYRYLTAQPEYIAPAVGSKRIMPPAQGASVMPTSTLTPAPVNTLGNLNAERRARLQEKLRLLYQQYDLETRVEEKMRIKAIIDQTEADLRGL
ncbi:SEFIR domain-containing protein [Thiothrix winogradskyi]|uniref:TIR domain-containing protein n=1 Tax=Thiothrix winogradskyi TaxID=96472 RepID=A0ABY3T010_9GAMM|nr:SEFIR domain-containing protein [Thiothrix winogradskyi]UJS24159.1 TIR domain-containing protein [Thiothrix winogradskyi]